MKKTTIVFDDWNGGGICRYSTETVEEALHHFINIHASSKATTLEGLLKGIRKQLNELPFVWIIFSDGEIIYTGIKMEEVCICNL